MATTAVASIEDVAECGVRADALVTGLLRRVMRQQRTVATALEYVRVLSKDTRANCWELALKAGHERAVPDAGPAQQVRLVLGGTARPAAGPGPAGAAGRPG